MPRKPPRLCSCGLVIPAGERCECEAARDRDRKARFDMKRPSSSARGYTSAWDKARAAFLEKHKRCLRCGDPATVVDHKTPHKGDKGLFWDRDNWQPLCAPCHNSAKQKAERASLKR